MPQLTEPDRAMCDGCRTMVFVRRNHRFDAFGPLICPPFLNDHLARRTGAVA